MTYRVIQWARGNLGRAATEGVVSHPELELAGCWVHSADKAGRDAGTLAGIDPLGVVATNDVAAILALEADCVLYSPLLAKPRETITFGVVGPGPFGKPAGNESPVEARYECS